MTITVPGHKLAFQAGPDAVSAAVIEAMIPLGRATGAPKARRFQPGQWDRLTDHFRFCVVRDPIDRLMDLYGEVWAQRDGIAANGAQEFPSNPDPDYFFTYLDDYRARSPLVKRGAMSIGLYIGTTPQDSFDRVFRDDEMRQLSRILSRRADRVVQVAQPQRPGRRLVLDDLLDETVDLLRPWLDQEYELLRGIYQNPLGPRRQAVRALEH